MTHGSEMNFDFSLSTQIIFGAGRLRELGPQAKRNSKRVLVVTGQNPDRAAPLRAILDENGVGVATFSISGEPDIATVERGTALAKKEKCDAVIGFGGGSVLDTGKAIAAMMTNEGELLDYLEVIGRGKSLTKQAAPFVAIPTTAGTGSEVTRNAVLASPEHRAKVSLRSPLMLPRVALVDPELAYDLPPHITATTGLDALTQLIEPYVCLRANPVTDGLCLEGIRLVAWKFREAVKNGRDAKARESMATASLFGGIALANAGLGAVHGLAGPIGGMFPAPHGAVCGKLLPHVMKMNLQALRQRDADSYAIKRYYRIAKMVAENPHATADAGMEWVQQLVSDFHVPGLATYGIKAEHFPEIAAKAAKASSMKANPIALTQEELIQILEQAI